MNHGVFHGEAFTLLQHSFRGSRVSAGPSSCAAPVGSRGSSGLRPCWPPTVPARPRRRFRCSISPGCTRSWIRHQFMSGEVGAD